jgi:putative tryptophan/tyrosine transport system substrate-binding protein
VGLMESAAAAVGIETIAIEVKSDSDIEAAMTSLARQPGSGLISIPDSFAVERRELMIALAGRLRLPAIYAGPFFTRSGGLMAYGPDTRDLMHRAADYVDRILRGTIPGELPVQQPTRLRLIINMKAAKRQGRVRAATSPVFHSSTSRCLENGWKCSKRSPPASSG